MRKRFTYIIIIISSISLIGIISTQLLWVNYALGLRKEIFDKRVQSQLKEIIDELTNNRDSVYKSPSCNNEIRKKDTLIIKDTKCCETNPCGNTIINNCNSTWQLSSLDTVLLDSLMHYSICSMMKVNEDYVYGIIDAQKHKLITCSNSNYIKELLNTYHTYPFSSRHRAHSKLLGVYFINQNAYIVNRMIFLLIVSSLFLIIVVVSFVYTILTLLRQKKLSEMKTDFVNNMTHEFKTPIATISLASEMLSKPSVLESKEKLMKYANIIYEENARLKNQVEQVLQISVLDKGDFTLNKKEIDLHEIIRDAVGAFKLIVNQRNGNLTTNLKAEPHHIFADPMHIYHVIINLLDNAVKYSYNYPLITISTRSFSNGVIFTIEDKGIGINLDNQKHIFKKLYRVPTGNIHNAKGFGLGLFYVKTMIDAHGGNIKLKSEIKKGTTFEIFFPFNHNLNTNTENAEI